MTGYKRRTILHAVESLRLCVSTNIALLFPTPERGFGITELEFVTGGADAAKENGYHLVLCPSEMHDPDELQQLTQQGLADGVVVMEVHLNDGRTNFGPDLLVAPVLYEGARSREVYLPVGAAWTDAWTDESIEGGQRITADAPLERIPLYLRGKARLPIRVDKG